MVKVVFFDVDGTLISHSQNAVPESTRTALNQLSEKGIQRVIATGRHMLELSFSDYVTSSVDNNGIKEALVALKIIA